MNSKEIFRPYLFNAIAHRQARPLCSQLFSCFDGDSKPSKLVKKYTGKSGREFVKDFCKHYVYRDYVLYKSTQHRRPHDLQDNEEVKNERIDNKNLAPDSAAMRLLNDWPAFCDEIKGHIYVLGKQFWDEWSARQEYYEKQFADASAEDIFKILPTHTLSAVFMFYFFDFDREDACNVSFACTYLIRFNEEKAAFDIVYCMPDGKLIAECSNSYNEVDVDIDTERQAKVKDLFLSIYTLFAMQTRIETFGTPIKHGQLMFRYGFKNILNMSRNEIIYCE